MATGFSTVNVVRHLTAWRNAPHNPAMPEDTGGTVQAEARRLTAIGKENGHDQMLIGDILKDLF